jgi:hypothetical protein
MTEGTLPPYRRRAVTAAGTGLLIVFVLAYGNQGLQNWRTKRLALATPSYKQPLNALDSVGWRVMPDHGMPGLNTTDALLAALVHNVVLIAVTAFLIHLAMRGVASRRGRWNVFVGSWGAVIVSSAIAGAAASPLFAEAYHLSLTVNRRTETLFYDQVSIGLLLGLLVGWLVGLAGVFAYRSSPETTSDPASPRDDDLFPYTASLGDSSSSSQTRYDLTPAGYPATPTFVGTPVANPSPDDEPNEAPLYQRPIGPPR